MRGAETIDDMRLIEVAYVVNLSMHKSMYTHVHQSDSILLPHN